MIKDNIIYCLLLLLYFSTKKINNVNCRNRKHTTIQNLETMTMTIMIIIIINSFYHHHYYYNQLLLLLLLQ